MAPEEPSKKLDYTQIEYLENAGRKYTGNHQEHWVDSKSLCTSCRSAHITRRHSQNKRMVYCNRLERVVPEDISECNEYCLFTQMSLHQMGEMAILIDARPDRYKGYL